MKKRMFIIMLAVLFSLSSVALAKEYPYKKIKMIIGYKPGGGYDTVARGIAPLLSKYLPNNPTILLVNKPGAGGIVAAQYLWSRKPDGYTFGLWNGVALVLAQKTLKVKYDMRKVSWLGRANTEVPVTAVPKGGRYKTWEDLKKANEIRVGHSGITALSGTTTILLLHSMLKKKLVMVPHDSSQEAIVAAFRGDVDVVSQSYSTLQPSVESGDLIPIVQFNDTPYKSVPKNVPTVSALGFPQLADIQTQRLIGGPPNMSPKLIKVIGDALMKAQTDPKMLEWSKKTKRPNNPLPPEKVKKVVNNLMDLMDRYADDIKSFMGKK